MNLSNYPSNSYKGKAEQKEKKLEKVNMAGGVKTRKKSGVDKFKDSVFSEDLASVRDYVIHDVIIPMIKKGILDTIVNGAEMAIYGEIRGGRQSSSPGYVPYRSYSDDRRNSTKAADFKLDDLIFDNKGDAVAVLKRMEADLNHYGILSVADLYDILDISGPYTSSAYGWTSVRTAEVIHVRDGYLLRLPKPKPID